MASYEELESDWRVLDRRDHRDWDNDDLQLAAELGRTLLERNKELETSLQHHQEKIEEQELEIEYLTKQHNALREANESRLRVYEQLDISIQNLECEKNQYLVENSSYKKQIKALSQNVENLDNKCEEITKTLEETKRLLDIERRKNERLQNESNKSAERTNFVALKPIERDEGHLSEPEEDEITEIDTTQPENFSYAFKNQSKSTDVTGSSSSACPFEFDQSSIDHLAEENEELIKIMQDLERTKKCLIAEQNRVAELEEQLAIMAQENHLFQSKLADINTNEEMKSVQQELSFLEEVRQGQMCSRCLKGFDQAYDDESSMITGTEDDESLMELMQNADTPHIYRSAVTITAKCCSICAHSSKSLHELPVNIVKLLLELWLHLLKKYTILKWILKLLQWPALLIYRMISLPTYDNLNFM